MGLTICYSGRFKKGRFLSAMINELKDIAEIYAWDYHPFEDEFPEDSLGSPKFNQKLYGISLSPPGCEPLWMCFLSDGRLSSPVQLQLWGNSKDETERRYLTKVFTKTQFAGVETHKVLIHLLKHISSKYFEEFELVDETGYWETGDEELLEERFREMNQLLDQVAFGMEHFPRNSGESFENYIARLLNQIHKHRK